MVIRDTSRRPARPSALNPDAHGFVTHTADDMAATSTGTQEQQQPGVPPIAPSPRGSLRGRATSDANRSGTFGAMSSPRGSLRGRPPDLQSVRELRTCLRCR